MRHGNVPTLVEELGILYKQLPHPFPQAECRQLRREHPSETTDLAAYLDLYFSNIAGYCSWGGKILQWTPEKMQKVREDLALSFFEKHPKYRALLPYINEASTPNLHRKLAFYETARLTLRELLSRLLAGEQNGEREPEAQ